MLELHEIQVVAGTGWGLAGGPIDSLELLLKDLLVQPLGIVHLHLLLGQFFSQPGDTLGLILSSCSFLCVNLKT